MAYSAVWSVSVVAEIENVVGPGTILGNFKLVKVLGHGGMGVVWYAQDMGLGRPVAVKVLKDDIRTLPSVVARFQREAEAFATLNHPNIVHIYSVGAVGDVPYLAMEYIDGAPLSRIMKRQRRVEWKTALKLVEQVANALACAHDANIVHRDIKPGNIMVDPSGRAYVTDFGIAKVLTAETQLTLEGSRLGTPEYMSPELCKNNEITASNDIYSLGVVLFQMLTARLPYEADTPIALIRKIISEPPNRVRDFLKSVPEDVERLVAYMIEKDPQHRPGNAHELARIVNRVRYGRTLMDTESALGAALETFRESEATPTPTPRHAEQTEVQAPRRNYIGALLGLWRRVPNRTRYLGASFLVVAAAGVGGWRLGERMNEDFALDAVRKTNSSTRSWWISGPVAQIMKESPGVISFELNLASFRLGAFDWLRNGTVLVQIDGLDRSPRKGQAALYSINPATRAIELVVAPKPVEKGRDLVEDALGVPRGARARPEPTTPPARIVAEALGSGGGMLKLVDRKTREVVEELGRGEAAVWHPSGSYVVAIVKDQKGGAQLWAVSVESPYARRQLTYIDGGVTGECLVSDDGAWVLTGKAFSTRRPAVVLADLSLVPF